MTLYTQDKVQEEKGPAIQDCKIWYADSWNRKFKDRNFDARRDDSSAQGATVKRKKETANTAAAKESKEIVFNGTPKDGARKAIRAAPATMKKKERERE